MLIILFMARASASERARSSRSSQERRCEHSSLPAAGSRPRRTERAPGSSAPVQSLVDHVIDGRLRIKQCVNCSLARSSPRLTPNDLPGTRHHHLQNLLHRHRRHHRRHRHHRLRRRRRSRSFGTPASRRSSAAPLPSADGPSPTISSSAHSATPLAASPPRSRNPTRHRPARSLRTPARPGAAPTSPCQSAGGG